MDKNDDDDDDEQFLVFLKDSIASEPSGNARKLLNHNGEEIFELAHVNVLRWFYYH